MQRFYFPDLDLETDNITIKNKDLINQLLKVLRVNIWYELIFFNGEDNIDQIYKIVSIDKREVYLEKIWEEKNNSEIDFPLNIFQALPNKIEKIEYILKKAVEVWVTGFYFYRSERSQKLNLSPNKIERLERIVIESVEQSWRSRIPELIIEDNICLDDFKWKENLYFNLDEKNGIRLSKMELDYQKWINLFIWPEGWFSSSEIEIFKNNNFKEIYLWKRILRTETVWVVVWFYIIQNK